jgi:hypothetical protein
MYTIRFVRLKSLEMHRNISYRIALHYVSNENFHTLKPHVAIPLFSMSSTLLEEVFGRFQIT